MIIYLLFHSYMYDSLAFFYRINNEKCRNEQDRGKGACSGGAAHVTKWKRDGWLHCAMRLYIRELLIGIELKYKGSNLSLRESGNTIYLCLSLLSFSIINYYLWFKKQVMINQ